MMTKLKKIGSEFLTKMCCLFFWEVDFTLSSCLFPPRMPLVLDLIFCLWDISIELKIYVFHINFNSFHLLLLKYENTVYLSLFTISFIDIISELSTQNIYIRKAKDKQQTKRKK